MRTIRDERGFSRLIYGPNFTVLRKGGTVHRRAIGLVALAGLALSGCAAVTDSIVETSGQSRGEAILSPSSKPVTVDNVAGNNRLRRLAAEQHPKIVASYGGEYNDPKLERTVARIVGELTTAGDNNTQIYNITVLDSPSINAFALPGGYLYITRGLLALASDSAELATVIAHEMAHVTANHGIERQKMERAETVATKVAEDLLGSSNAARAAAIRGQLRLAQFSRGQELAADAIGIRATAAAGFDPYAAVRFLRSLSAYTRFRSVTGAKPELDFLASHPTSERRMEIAQRLARQQGGPGVGTRARDAYLAGIDGMTYGDTAREGFIRGRDFLHPRIGIGFRVPEGFVIDNSSEAVTAAGPNDMAIRFDGVRVARSISLTDYLASGWIGGLDPNSVEAGQVNGLPYARARAAADGWEFAISVYRVDNTVYRLLTAAPVGTKELARLAHTTARSFRVLPKSERATLKPLRIRIVTASGSDTIGSLAAKMAPVTRKEQLFLVLNGLSKNDRIRAGEKFKLVVE
ncbi:metalloprotease [Notoacmeibacter marinus]|uniref:Metalloprotease n=1 Tax=Notoacmeibacter marinus TaxID=1876515 RepID=A0A231V3F4_9HYPH|nr:M48 family metalloprotease [Notoacmeibacter marinus]OXT02551.1 metalloprotease [Notoacmeibacter marinus]